MRLTPAIAVIGAISAHALADAGSHNAVIIVDPASTEAMYVANYYKTARHIPDRNVIYMSPGAANLAEFADANVNALLGTLFNRHLQDHADIIIIPAGSPFFVPASGYVQDGCAPVNRFSITSAYACSFIYDLILPGTSYNLPAGYFSATGAPLAFDSNTEWLSGNPSDSEFAKRYFIGALLGYTGDNGNTLDEVLENIDRSVAADGTRPDGTFYFMNNTADPPRNIRSTQFPAAIAALTDAGHDALQINAQKLPLGHDDCLGILSGFSDANIASVNYTILPGAFCDHLTSWAATFDKDAQSKVSAWIAKGASASDGTVEEACNYPGKFIYARFHYYYAEGLSIGEAYLRSIAWGPFQNLLYGDPLARAHTYIPVVQITDLPAGPVSGMLTLSPFATTDHPDAAIDTLELYIDGALADTIDPAEAFTIDTTSLDDGNHEFRVVAYDDTTVNAAGDTIADLEVANGAGAIHLGASPLTGKLTTAVTFTIDDFAGRDVERFRLTHNGRVLGAAPVSGSSASVTVHANMIGAGESTIRAEAVLADGDVVRSNPITLDIDYASDQVAFPTPVAFDYHISVLEDQPFVVELPATFRDDPAGAVYQIVDGPDHATVYDNTTSAYRIMLAQAAGAATDQFTFKVTTPSGTSNTATVNITYELNGCNADVNHDGALNILDFVTYQGLFQAGDDGADANHDGNLNILDFVAFQQLFVTGCR